MRLIDADALKHELVDDYERNDMFYPEYHSEALRIFSGMIDAQQTVGRWISVKDRLPEKDQDVVMYCSWIGSSGEVYKEIGITSVKTANHLGFVPIAWMPLPEPPKEKSDGNRT